jgi:tRNA(fMet)-specific endonuclease VapC
MSFVVDTDICSAFLKGDRRVLNRFSQYAGGLNISAVTEAELYSWAYRTAQSPQRIQAVQELLNDVAVVPVDSAIARRCGEERASMLDKGLVIAVPDLLIATTALYFDFTMVTHNTKHFSLVPGLRLQDWMLP